MTRLQDIPVRVELDAPKKTGHAIAREVLQKVRAALAEWLTTGKAEAIDLKNVPRMGPATYQYLKDALSSGEVTIVIKAEVRVEIRETQYPGVWWVTHINDQGDIVTEIIEVTEIPAILKPHILDVGDGLQRLEQVLRGLESEGSSVSVN
jgi:hydrogenase-1 operon protein HyaF